ncbi:MAG: hypothetical protein QOF75_2955, partial [Gaiellaceae bacterium]|nr:hypothetical protein [Gaiellaceae bacterium]
MNRTTQRRRLGVVVLMALATASALAAAAGAGNGVLAKTAVPAFTNFELAGTPPNPPGTVCPGSPACSNGAAEPAIRATPDGKFFGASENGLGGGTLAWASTDGGNHYY